MLFTIISAVLLVVSLVLYIVSAASHNKVCCIVSAILILAGSGVAIVDGAVITAALWIVFYLISLVGFFFHFFKNKEYPLWIWIGGLVATAFSGFDFALILGEGSLSLILNIVLPIALFAILAFALGIPLAHFKNKKKFNVKPHVTTGTIVGMRFEVVKKATPSETGRINVGDIDWAIGPRDGKSVFEIGDHIIVRGISGVTLLCDRDQEEVNNAKKLSKKEMRLKKAEEKLFKKNAEMEKRAARELEAAAKIAQIEAERDIKKAEIEANLEIEKAKILADLELKKAELLLLKPEADAATAEEEVPEEIGVQPVATDSAEEPVAEEPAEVDIPVVEEPVEEPIADNEKKKYPHVSFVTRFVDMDDETKANYNTIKNELVSYGLKSRFSRSGDVFRLHRVTYAKITAAGKGLKIYLALDPKDYENSTIPVIDVSSKKAFAEIPLVFKIKSPLSIKRAKQLISDMMAKRELPQGEIPNIDWVSENLNHLNDEIQYDEDDLKEE